MATRKTNNSGNGAEDRVPVEIAPRYHVVDLFSGCGGLSLGFALSGRFDAVFACDIKPEAVETFRINHETCQALLGQPVRPPTAVVADIQHLSESDVLAALRPYGISRPGELACLVGGPPCEGFSQNRSLGAGRKPTPGIATRINKFIDEPRNWLFKWLVQIAGALRPAVVLIENVPGLIRHRDGTTREEILDALSAIGYRTSVRVLNAANFGVPQMRRRAFFLAQRKEDYERTALRLEFPQPTHRPYPMMHPDLNTRRDWLPGDAGYWPTVWEAVGDLPAAFDSDDFDHATVKYPSAPITGLRRFLQSPDGQVPYHHVARALGKNGLRKIQALRAGERADSLPDEIRPSNCYHYSYARLNWGEPARTITKSAYHVGAGMFTHPEEDRAITMREAARLQTFPDWVRFSTNNIRELSALIGSAVPPLLALHIARQVLGYLDQLTYASLNPDKQKLVRTQATDAVLKRLEEAYWSSEERLERCRITSEKGPSA